MQTPNARYFLVLKRNLWIQSFYKASGEYESSRRVKSELLVQVDAVSNRATNEDGSRKLVMVFTATNFPWDIDEALRRRLEKRIYIPFPNFESRKELIRIYIYFRSDASLNGMKQKIAGNAHDEVKNMSKDEISKDSVAMCDFEEASWWEDCSQCYVNGFQDHNSSHNTS